MRAEEPEPAWMTRLRRARWADGDLKSRAGLAATLRRHLGPLEAVSGLVWHRGRGVWMRHGHDFDSLDAGEVGRVAGVKGERVRACDRSDHEPRVCVIHASNATRHPSPLDWVP